MIATDQRRLLVVEDDPEISYLFSVILEEPDREIVTVGTGDEAVRVLDAGDVDLVVLDLILPDIDGRTLLMRMRERPETAGIPVIVVSAREGSEIRQDCYDLGADLFVAKPFDADHVAAEIAVRLERSVDRERVSHHDPVTGLLNRAGLLEACADITGSYALALLQLDGFLGLSEDWGWGAAERILAAVGEAIADGADRALAAGRIGGGEFALPMTTSRLDEAARLAERTLGSVRALKLNDPDGEALRMTASVGVVAVAAGTPIEEALEAARRRLFQAREAGGNQVVAEDPGEDAVKKRVLVAEDDEISATILVHRLRKEGLDIDRYANGKEAYEAALAETPHLVILDVKMPGMDGFEVLERLRRTPAYSSVPIILLTSMGSEADVVRGFQLGVDDYILKPFSPVELSARVWRLLRRGRSASAV